MLAAAKRSGLMPRISARAVQMVGRCAGLLRWLANIAGAMSGASVSNTTASSGRSAMTLRQRSALAPEVPTIEEAGVKGYEATYWFAAYAPAGTPAPVVTKLNELLHKAAHSSAQAAFYQPTGTETYLNTPEEQRKFQAAESQKWGRIIKAAGIEPE